MIDPIISLSTVRTDRPEAGQLVTALVALGHGEFAECGCRLTRLTERDAWVTVADLNPPAFYRPGDAFVIDADKVVDW